MVQLGIFKIVGFSKFDFLFDLSPLVYVAPFYLQARHDFNDFYSEYSDIFMISL